MSLSPRGAKDYLPLRLKRLRVGACLVATSVGGIPDVLASFKAGAAVPSRSPEALSGALIDVLTGKCSFIVDRGSMKGVYDWTLMVEKNLKVYDEFFDTYDA